MRILLFIGLSLAFARPQTPCREFRQFFWNIDIATKTLTRVGTGSKTTSLCEPLPSTGSENVRLELYDGGKKVFERKIHVQDAIYFDSPGGGGGVVQDPRPRLMTYLPEIPLTPTSHLKLIDLEKNEVLASGKP